MSCSGDVTCPPNFTTTDNTTRNYTFTNLTLKTNYTFSVVATNSIGSGEAGVVMITTPGEFNFHKYIRTYIATLRATYSSYIHNCVCTFVYSKYVYISNVSHLPTEFSVTNVINLMLQINHTTYTLDTMHQHVHYRISNPTM